MSKAGGCLCGDVRFRIEGETGRVTACHCTQCQRWSGTYWSSVSVPQDALVIEHGAESLAWYPSSERAERGFCVICGASLFWRQIDEAAPHVAVAIGALDQPTGLSVDLHIFTADKGDAYQIGGDAPRAAGDG
ncbi:GFA family protein [Parvularcula dongshanensis]|uniref:CENP-V/GFA domain-containing protein n=1 Tax=Parvularcula dongshanensis TaxID=1173995 RepID=A0A840I0T3_9PROT|nr:hypothetical protein [Parvularcula dongshanensis]